jgi:hypothetical protein
MRRNKKQHAGGEHESAKANGDQNRPAQVLGLLLPIFKLADSGRGRGVHQASGAPSIQGRLPRFGHSSSGRQRG